MHHICMHHAPAETELAGRHIFNCYQAGFLAGTYSNAIRMYRIWIFYQNFLIAFKICFQRSFLPGLRRRGNDKTGIMVSLGKLISMEIKFLPSIPPLLPNNVVPEKTLFLPFFTAGHFCPPPRAEVLDGTWHTVAHGLRKYTGPPCAKANFSQSGGGGGEQKYPVSQRKDFY